MTLGCEVREICSDCNEVNYVPIVTVIVKGPVHFKYRCRKCKKEHEGHLKG